MKKSNYSRLVYAGAGTSGRLGLQDGIELHPTFGWPLERLEFLLAGGYNSLIKPVFRLLLKDFELRQHI